MPTWNDLLGELKVTGSAHDVIRRRQLDRLFQHTGRNAIVYYSGWLQKPQLEAPYGINDNDKNGFMATIHKMDRSKGLDLILHTPGGEAAATESLVAYLRTMFGHNIRAIVPQIAMSAGTMVALSCDGIILGKHSSLGPIDPQLGGVPAHGIIEEFAQARADVLAQPNLAMLWQPILAKYHPTLIGEAQKAIDWSNAMVADWLKTGMFRGDGDKEAKAQKVIDELADHELTKSHDRHISIDKAREIGLKVESLETDPELQDRVLSVHHACVQTLTGTPAYKLIENHMGIAFIEQATMFAKHA